MQGPVQHLIFLGVLLDTVQCTMSLPEVKLKALLNFSLEFSLRVRASKRHLQVLAGKLNWACRVVYGGRTFLGRILDQINHLNCLNAKVKFNKEFYADLSWWISFLSVFNSKCMFLEKVPTTDIQTDECPTAAGAFFHGDSLYHSFVLDISEVRNLHINFKEVLAIILADKRWGKLWCNKHVIIQSDNTTAVSIINKGTTGNLIIMRYLRELLWLSAAYNFRITATYLPDCMNNIADAISRMHEPYCLFKTLGYLLPFYCGYYTLLFDCPLLYHMSILSCGFLHSRYFGT